jgi:hypothetical protein
VLRRVIAAIGLIALASTPVVARTRLVCRYTGVEITDCQQNPVPGSSEIQIEGCCDRQTTQPPGVTPIAQQQQSSPLVLIALPATLLFAAPARPPPVRDRDVVPPVFLINRALLI